MARTRTPKIPGESSTGGDAAEVMADASKLPDQDDIDPKSITKAVLSKQGWVVPEAKPKSGG